MSAGNSRVFGKRQQDRKATVFAGRAAVGRELGGSRKHLDSRLDSAKNLPVSLYKSFPFLGHSLPIYKVMSVN